MKKEPGRPAARKRIAVSLIRAPGKTPETDDLRSARVSFSLYGTKHGLGETSTGNHGQRSLKTNPIRKLNPALKNWIDNVIVPALIKQWISSKT
jgi:hypothetical protein